MKARVFFYRGYLQALFILLLVTYVWAYLTYMDSQPPGNRTAYPQALPRSPNLTRQHPPQGVALLISLKFCIWLYLNMANRDWITIQQFNHNVPPLLKITGTGPEGDAPIVLVRFEGS